MKLKNIVAEDFVNYKSPSMFLVTCQCNWKCCEEAHIPHSVCQNNPLIQQPTIDIPNQEIYNMYINNPITKSIVVGGLEPMLQFDELISLIDCFRKNDCNDTFVIYTGYYPNEIEKQLMKLKSYCNIIIKFGRYIPNQQPHYDNVLGVNLASNNQYAEQIS